jgi:hypothetical protein
MEHSPTYVAKRTSTTYKMPRIIWNQLVHYYIHNLLPTIPTFSQINTVHDFSSHHLKIHCNFKVTHMTSPKWTLSLRVSHQIPLCNSALPHTCYMLSSLYSRLFDRLTNSWLFLRQPYTFQRVLQYLPQHRPIL